MGTPKTKPIDLLNGSENVESRSGVKYIIKNIPIIYLSDECLTPNNPPRITQVTYGKQLSRFDGRDYFDPRDADHTIPKPVLDKWVLKNRELWVPRPGENDVFLHEIAAKYAKSDNYDPRFLPKNQLFPRPYYLELDCLEEYRKQGVEKCKDPNFICEKITDTTNKNEHCDIEPPFWWKEEKPLVEAYVCQEVDSKKKLEESKRWKPKVNIMGTSRDWCERRLLMNRVGQPFKHEACVFYNENHPSPTYQLTKIKFSI